MGPDGHIASLFPGHDFMDASETRVSHVASSPKPPAERMTLTLSTLKRSSQHILVALGESKREALERLLRGDDALPATHLSNLTIVTNIQLREAEA